MTARVRFARDARCRATDTTRPTTAMREQSSSSRHDDATRDTLRRSRRHHAQTYALCAFTYSLAQAIRHAMRMPRYDALSFSSLPQHRDAIEKTFHHHVVTSRRAFQNIAFNSVSLVLALCAARWRRRFSTEKCEGVCRQMFVMASSFTHARYDSLAAFAE